MQTANQNQTSSLITVTRQPQAAEGTPSALILKGKFISGEIQGAKSKKSEADGSLKYYTGDLVLSASLPSCAVSQFIPAGTLTPEQAAQLDNILTQEQERKLRARVISQALNFGDSYSFPASQFNLAATFTPERRGDGLTADAIKGLFNSREWISVAPSYYSTNQISAAGSATGERLITSVLRSTANTPAEVWKKLADRFNGILTLAIPTLSEEQAATAAAILTRLLSAAEGKAVLAESID